MCIFTIKVPIFWAVKRSYKGGTRKRGNKIKQHKKKELQPKPFPPL